MADGPHSCNAHFTSPTQESIWKVTRQLKKEQCSLYNCVASILSDAAFVSEIRELYPTIPLLANLRCGLWYTRQAEGTCYFKSTDGHNGNWSFSCTRLNWNVCELAAAHGGVIIVDATRKGKRFPDAMTKTIPIWAAVVNRAVARKRGEVAMRQAAAAAAEEAAAAATATAASVAEEVASPQLACKGGGAPMVPGQAQQPSGMGAGLAEAALDPPGFGAPTQCSSPCALPCPTLARRGRVASSPFPPASAAVSGSVETEGCASVGSLSMWLQCSAAAEAEVAALAPANPPPTGSGTRLTQPRSRNDEHAHEPAREASEGGTQRPRTAPSTAGAQDPCCNHDSSGWLRGFPTAASAVSTHAASQPGPDAARGARTCMEFAWERSGASQPGDSCAVAATTLGDAEAAGEVPSHAVVGAGARGECCVDLGAASASHVSCSTGKARRKGPTLLSPDERSDDIDCCCHGTGSRHSQQHAWPGVQCGLRDSFSIHADGDGRCSDACTGSSGSANGSDSSSSEGVGRSNSCGSDNGDAGRRRAAATMGRGWPPCPHCGGGGGACTRSSAPACRACGQDDPASTRSSAAGCEFHHPQAAQAAAPAWDERLHLPLWISSNERAQIEKRLDGWVDALLRVGADVEGLAKVLRKPLRPLWISQASSIWLDQVAQPEQLPFTPLYLVSASQPHSYVRQAGTVSDDDAGGCSDGDDSEPTSGPGPARKRPQRRPHRPHACTYVYVPGAGDDEESWAAGLTPAVFWAHYPKLLRAGPAGVHDAVRELLQQEAAELAEHGTNSSTAAAHGSAIAGQAAGGVDPQAATAAAVTAAAAAGYAAVTDAHHLLPAGCAASSVPVRGPCSMYLLGGTRIALGNLAAGAAPECWRHVGAVLSCGTTPHPSMAGEPQWQCGQQYGDDPRSTQLSALLQEESAAQEALRAAQVEARGAPAEDANREGAGAGIAAGGPLQDAGHDSGFTFRPPHEPCARRGDEHCDHHHQHHDGCRGEGQRGPCPNGVPAAPRYLHLPVQHFKQDRVSLAQHLGPALRFLSHHLSRGRTVLVHDNNGQDTCVCIAVALLLACYSPCGGSNADAGGPAWLQPYAGPGAPAAPVCKDSVRQRLAYVSSAYPLARPTRGMLRQVFNHFVCGTVGVREGSASGGTETQVEGLDLQ